MFTNPAPTYTGARIVAEQAPAGQVPSGSD